MSEVTVEQVKSALKSMPAEDLKRVLDYAASRVATSDRLNTKQATQAAELYQALSEAYALEFGAPCQPFAAWRAKGGSVRQLAQVRRQFDEVLLGANITLKVSRMQAYRFLWTLVVDRIRKSRVPVTPTTMVRFGSGIVGLFDHAFPGYLQSGLAGIVFSRFAKLST